MEKKTPSRSETLKPVKLYLDDLEQIVSILKAESSEVKIETDEYKYESLEELVGSKKETIYKLKLICGKWPHVDLNLNSYSVELFISEDEPKLRGVFEKIKEILVKRERIYRRFVSFRWAMIFSLAPGIIFLGKVVFFPSAPTPFSFLWFFIILSLIINLWLRLERDKYSIIVLKHKIDQESFLKRNKDQVWLLIFGAVFGIVGTVLGAIVLNFLK